MRFPLLPLALVFAANFACAGEIVRRTDHFEFVYRLRLPEVNGPAQLWVPVARADRFQDVKVERVVAALPWRMTTDRSGTNDVLVAAPANENGGKTIEITYIVTRREKGPYADGADPKPALRPDRLVPNDARFQALAKAALLAEPAPIAPARALYDHVFARMKYDKTVEGSGRGDAVFACNARAGNCSDFHSYFVALARAADIPARFAIGLSIPADRDEGLIQGYHCWAEFSTGGEWVAVDISEAAKHPELKEYYFGHQPANRFELSRGRDLQLDPPPACGPVNFLIYPLLEIEGKAVEVKTEFAFHRLKE
jgi:transglutaminase-like putative cysteine protease